MHGRRRVPAIKRKWSDTIENVSGQGDAPDIANPVSPSGQFFAFASKVEELDDQGTVFVMLDMMTFEWATTASSNTQTVAAPALLGPSTLFALAAVNVNTLATTLGVTDPDLVSDGAWFYVTLTAASSDDNSDPLTGELVDGLFPDDPGTRSYGAFTLTGGQLLLIPAPQPNFTVTLQPPPAANVTTNFITLSTVLANLLQRMGAWFFPPAPMTAPPPPPAAVPPIVAIGVMDVGAGGCNLLFKQTPNSNPPTLEPFAYLDVGRATPWTRTTEPGNLLPTAPQPSGPITQNTTGTLGAVLTHWDYDHWMLASVAGMTNLPWMVCVQQPYGPSCATMTARFPARTTFPAGLTSLTAPGGEYTLYVVRPQTNIKAEIMNNSGLVMLVPFVFPVANGATTVHACLLPGDASLGNIHPTMPQNNLSVYGAVHHGAGTFGATQNIPPPVVPQGAVVYSYGIKPNQVHAFGHPTQAAITANVNAGWMLNRQFATAETMVVNGAMPGFNGMRGNVLIGQQRPLAAAYVNTAFFAMTHQVT